MKLFICVVLVALLLFGANSQLGRTRLCYREFCPARTVACEQIIRSSPDGLRILVQVNCLNQNRTVLQTFNRSMPNLLGPSWNMEGVSLMPAEDSDSDNMIEQNDMGMGMGM